VTRPGAIVIGGSAGAVDALAQILPGLTAACPPVVVVVHIPRDQGSLLAHVLGPVSQVPVHEAVDKQPLRPGCVTVAPADYHLLIEDAATLALSRDPLVHFSRPSIDVLFESAARALGARCAGVLLTGSSRDGAAGLLAIRRRGGATAVQAPASALAAQMPRAAIELGAAERVLELDALRAWLRALAEEDPS
jgi:two-component system, chemotaxis family, protein-glutamate methylesterase/glutaminase